MQNVESTLYTKPRCETRLRIKNLKNGEVYGVFVFDAVGQLIQQTKVNTANPSIRMHGGNGFMSMLLTNRKQTRRFNVAVVE